MAGISGGYYYGHVFLALGVGKTIDDHTFLEGAPPDDLHLTYYCNGEPLAIYQLRDGHLVARISKDDIFRSLRKASKGEKAGGTGITNTIQSAASFVAGGGAVRFAKPVIATLKSSENKKYTIPGILAATSGFYFGYVLATNSLPACDSVEALLFIRSEDGWKTIAELSATTMWLKAMAFAGGKDQAFTDRLIQIDNHIKTHDVSSSDFAFLGIATGQLAQTENQAGTDKSENEPADKQNDVTKTENRLPQNWLDFFLLIVSPIILLLFLAALIFLVMSKQMKARSRPITTPRPVGNTVLPDPGMGPNGAALRSNGASDNNHAPIEPKIRTRSSSRRDGATTPTKGPA